MTIESFLEGHVRAFDWLGGVRRECVYDNLTSAVAKRERVDGRDVVSWNQRFSKLRGHYAFHATACTPQTPRDKGSGDGAVRHHKTGVWPARRFDDLAELDAVYAGGRDRVALPRRHATGRHVVAERLAHEREHLRPLPPCCFASGATVHGDAARAPRSIRLFRTPGVAGARGSGPAVTG